MTSPPGRNPARSRASGIQRRLAIIEATLRVMTREGLRAVSHRAVAAEAGVPLAATTYYFRDLEDLIIESFLHWSALQRREVEAFHARALAVLAAMDPARATRDARAEALADAVGGYVQEQVQGHRGDRVLEYAFLHEAVRVPRLRIALEQQQRGYLGFLEQFHRALGSTEPAIDAQISNSVLLGLEKGALLADGRLPIRPVLLRYLQQVLESTPERR